MDDIIILGASLERIVGLKADLSAEFSMKDMGELQYFLDIQVQRNRVDKRITIQQNGYANMILDRFHMQDAAPVSVPLPQGVKLTKLDGESVANAKTYQSKVGSLMYAMLCTHPDLAYAVSQISQFSNNPSDVHDSAANRVFKYLRGTSNFGITYDGNQALVLGGYSDANWGSGEDRKSMGGYVFTLCGGAVSWAAKKQPTVALSSTESEYMALTQAAKESMWIQYFLGELGRTAKSANIIYGDNQGSIALAKNPEYHAQTKHIDIQYYFIRECVEEGLINLQYIPTEDMIADGMTKALARDRHHLLISRMGVSATSVSTTPSLSHQITNLDEDGE